MKRRSSISLRLTLWFSAAFILGFLIFGIAMYAELSYSLAAGRDKTLLHRADRAATLLTNCHVGSQACVQRFDDFAAGTPEGNLIHVFDENGNRLYPLIKDPSDTFPWPSGPSPRDRTFSKVKYQGSLFRMLSEPVTIGGGKYWIVIGGQLKDNRMLVNQFKHGLLWTAPILLVFSAAIGFFLSTRALRPVARLISSVRLISIGNLSRRLPPLHSGDELEALTETCNEMLARLETAVGQITRFTADASHELRSPISYIYTQSEYALKNLPLEEESAECFSEILRECEEATSLLSDMLTLARCDSGHSGMIFTRTNLKGILDDVYLRAVPLAKSKRQNLTFEVDKNEPAWIMGDAPSLRRLFWIMLDNAIKYTPIDGQISIRLRTGGNEARVDIQDNGIGIPQEALPNIFGRFYRVDKARTFAEGSGLGLSIAKWISDIHRGDLSVKSSENIGSVFQISFGTISASL
jgi:signal transduction histidine kinase